ncbi:MAG: hypothetical protein JRN67_12810, partial [Nitrososphaerota archaeon]|nr:hypothetical protein [Nitrososphaerota archaeon]
KMCYSSFKDFLATNGFTVFPIEFDCGYTRHPLVDIAAKMGGFYWAFEYKSEGDSICRGLEQVRCYANWFDYVVLVSEHWFDHTKSEIYWKLRALGAGIWNYSPSADTCTIRKNPELQIPDKRGRRLVERRFRALRKSGYRPEPIRSNGLAFS